MRPTATSPETFGLQIPPPQDKYVPQKELRNLTKLWGGETWGSLALQGKQKKDLLGSELHKF